MPVCPKEGIDLVVLAFRQGGGNSWMFLHEGACRLFQNPRSTTPMDKQHHQRSPAANFKATQHLFRLTCSTPRNHSICVANIWQLGSAQRILPTWTQQKVVSGHGFQPLIAEELLLWEVWRFIHTHVEQTGWSIANLQRTQSDCICNGCVPTAKRPTLAQLASNSKSSPG